MYLNAIESNRANHFTICQLQLHWLTKFNYNYNYNHLKICDWLQLITITNYDYPSLLKSTMSELVKVWCFLIYFIVFLISYLFLCLYTWHIFLCFLNSDQILNIVWPLSAQNQFLSVIKRNNKEFMKFRRKHIFRRIGASQILETFNQHVEKIM